MSLLNRMPLYSGTAESPRTSLFGFLLMVLFFVQFLTGFLLLPSAKLSTIFVGFVPLLHRVLPLILVCIAILHASRSVLWQYGTGSKAIRSGINILFVLIAVLSTGYMASCGEAGFWGGVISFSPIISVVLFIFSSFFAFLISQFAVYGVKYVTECSVLGATSINTSVFEIALVIHILFGTLVVVHILSHSGIVHGASSVFGHSSKEVFKLSILSSIESRDLRFGVFFIILFLLINQDSMWLLRLGNAQYLSTEIKAPNKVMTELYLSSIYDLLRQYPILVVAFIFIVVFTMTYIVFGMRINRWCAVFVFFSVLVTVLNRSFAGFIGNDFDFVSSVQFVLAV